MDKVLCSGCHAGGDVRMAVTKIGYANTCDEEATWSIIIVMEGYTILLGAIV
jgi:hypothetical protein